MRKPLNTYLTSQNDSINNFLSQAHYDENEGALHYKDVIYITDEISDVEYIGEEKRQLARRNKIKKLKIEKRELENNILNIDTRIKLSTEKRSHKLPETTEYIQANGECTNSKGNVDKLNEKLKQVSAQIENIKNNIANVPVSKTLSVFEQEELKHLKSILNNIETKQSALEQESNRKQELENDINLYQKEVSEKEQEEERLRKEILRIEDLLKNLKSDNRIEELKEKLEQINLKYKIAEYEKNTKDLECNKSQVRLKNLEENRDKLFSKIKTLTDGEQWSLQILKTLEPSHKQLDKKATHVNKISLHNRLQKEELLIDDIELIDYFAINKFTKQEAPSEVKDFERLLRENIYVIKNNQDQIVNLVDEIHKLTQETEERKEQLTKLEGATEAKLTLILSALPDYIKKTANEINEAIKAAKSLLKQGKNKSDLEIQIRPTINEADLGGYSKRDIYESIKESSPETFQGYITRYFNERSEDLINKAFNNITSEEEIRAEEIATLQNNLIKEIDIKEWLDINFEFKKDGKDWEELSGENIKEMSGGQAARVNIMLTAAPMLLAKQQFGAEAPIILGFDEMFSNIDTTQVKYILDSLLSMGVTIIGTRPKGKITLPYTEYGNGWQQVEVNKFERNGRVNSTITPRKKMELGSVVLKKLKEN